MVMPQPLTKKQWLMASLNLAIDQEPDVRLSFRHQFILSRHEWDCNVEKNLSHLRHTLLLTRIDQSTPWLYQASLSRQINEQILIIYSSTQKLPTQGPRFQICHYYDGSYNSVSFIWHKLCSSAICIGPEECRLFYSFLLACMRHSICTI
jgi:hypothetical protein